MHDAAELRYDPWLSWRALSETWAAGLDPLGQGRHLREQRLAELLRSTTAGSPLYRARLAGHRRGSPALGDFAPIGKAELMHDFDRWATDRRITRTSVEAFLDDPDHLAGAYLGRYLVWTSSGTTGEPGIFVQDAPSLAAFDAIDALRLRGQTGIGALPTWGLTQRFAFVGATGGHFAGNASIARLQGLAPPLARPFAPPLQVFSVLTPLHELAAQLQDYAPTVLITYPSCAAALALEQAAGRLHLALAETWVGGEQLSPEQRRQIVGAFGGALRNNYGASEFFSIAWECPHGHLHLNSDWVILEPVDEKTRPVPPGHEADSVLLTNLANLTQPLVRYRLGDRVTLLAETGCACGSAFPRIEVQGRADDTLVLDDGDGHEVTLLPLALCTAIEEGAGVAQFQVLRRAPNRLEMRLEGTQPEPRAASAAACAALDAFLHEHGLHHIHIVQSRKEPVRQPRTGKLNRVSSSYPA
ncbi:MAG: phenylacetate--CoA ligase family protein [Rhizobacter sp.]|nr:phenylacetate--CoA ligase family protein [Rhizobacter sp.]